MNFWDFANARPILSTVWLILAVAAVAARGPLVVVRPPADKPEPKE